MTVQWFSHEQQLWQPVFFSQKTLIYSKPLVYVLCAALCLVTSLAREQCDVLIKDIRPTKPFIYVYDIPSRWTTDILEQAIARVEGPT